MQNFDSSMKQNKCERGKKMQVVIEIPKEVLYDTVTLCLVIALQKLVKPVVRRDSYGGLFVIIG